jgi:hypothetical protein
LVLSDRTVETIDRLAYREGISRSELIDRVLAEYTRQAQPQAGAMRDVLDALNAVLNRQNELKATLAAEDGVLYVRSALQYKYNSGVRYEVRLSADTRQILGELRVSLRAPDPVLLLYLGQFYKLWAKLEDACLEGPRRVYQFGAGQYTRVLRTPQGVSSAQAGEAVAGYVRLFDDCVRTFFDSVNDANHAVRTVQYVYKQGLDAITAQL